MKYDYGSTSLPGDEVDDEKNARQIEQGGASAPQTYQRPAVTPTSAPQSPGDAAPYVPPTTFAAMQAQGVARPPDPSNKVAPDTAPVTGWSPSYTSGAAPYNMEGEIAKENPGQSGLGAQPAPVNTLGNDIRASLAGEQQGAAGGSAYASDAANALGKQDYGQSVIAGQVPSYITDPAARAQFSSLMAKMNAGGPGALSGEELAAFNGIREFGTAGGQDAGAKMLGGAGTGAYGWDATTGQGDLPPGAGIINKAQIALNAQGGNPTLDTTGYKTEIGPTLFQQANDAPVSGFHPPNGPGGVTGATPPPTYTAPGGTPATTGTPAVETNTGNAPGFDILNTLVNGASGHGAGSAVQDATQAKTLDLLNNPSAYGGKDVKDFYDYTSGNIDDQYDATNRGIGENMARRGLGTSTIYAGNLNDSNIGRRTAKVANAQDLAHQYATSLDSARQGAVSTGNTVGQTAQNSALSWLQNLIGFGQQGFENDVTTNQQNQNETDSYRNYILGLLGYGQGAGA